MKTAYRFLFLLTAVWSTNVAIAGNLDVEIHCSPKRVDQTVKKASDGGANETKEHWVYDVTIENKTFKELTNLDLKYVIFFKQEQLGVKAAPTPRQQNGSISIDFLKSHQSGRAKQVEPSRSLALRVRRETECAGHARCPGGGPLSRQSTVR
jgi:hypothetical protein